MHRAGNKDQSGVSGTSDDEDDNGDERSIQSGCDANRYMPTTKRLPLCGLVVLTAPVHMVLYHDDTHICIHAPYIDTYVNTCMRAYIHMVPSVIGVASMMQYHDQGWRRRPRRSVRHVRSPKRRRQQQQKASGIRGGENPRSGMESQKEQPSQDIPRGMERLPRKRGMDMGARGKLG